MTSAKAGSTSFAVPEPWTVVADGYDAHTRGFLARFSLAALDYLVLEPTFHVLDVGCGPGTTVLQLARRVEALTAVDFSSEMLRALQNHLSQEGIENVTVLEADGQQLPMQGERFELALSMFGLMFFPDRPRGLSELIRVLRPGGQVLIGGWAPVSRSSLMGLVFDAMQAADPAMGAPPPDLSSYQNRQVLEQELRDAGFVDVRTVEVEEHQTWPHAEAMWQAMVEGGAPLKMYQKSLGPAEWARRSALALAHIKARFPKGPVRLGSVAHLGLGRKPA